MKSRISKENQKKFWRIFGLFIAFIVFFFLVLFGMSKISSKRWNEGLKESIQTLITQKYPDTWIIGNPVHLNSAFSTSANLYELRSRDNVEKNYAIIIRTTTLYGHMPAVYIYNKTKGPEFVGYAAVQGRVKKLLEDNYVDSSISFWLERIPLIIQKAEEGAKK